MIVVIQCAGTKRPDAGMMHTKANVPVKFVAHPEIAPNDGALYARPDELADQGVSWRELLVRYNNDIGDNPLGLLPAYGLYSPPIYQQLADGVGRKRLFILSAGWGIVRADYLTPNYDITFSNAVRKSAPHKQRKKGDQYADFCMLPSDVSEPIHFFGGNDYLPLFLTLTNGMNAPRNVFYVSKKTPIVPGCTTVRFETTQRTNWHYSCAAAFLDQTLNSIKV